MALIPRTQIARELYLGFQAPPSLASYMESFQGRTGIVRMECRNAGQKVVEISELLLGILHKLSLGELLRLRAISKYWHDVLICDIYPRRLPYFMVYYTLQPRPPDRPIFYNQAIAAHLPGWNGALENENGHRLVSFPAIGDDAEPPYMYFPQDGDKSQVRHFNAVRHHHASWLDMQVTWPPSRKVRVSIAQPVDWHAHSAHASQRCIEAPTAFFKEIVNPQGVTMKQLVRLLWAAFAFRVTLGPHSSDLLDGVEHLIRPMTTYGMFQTRSWVVHCPRSVKEEEEWWQQEHFVFDSWDQVENELINWWREVVWWNPAEREVEVSTRLNTIWE